MALLASGLTMETAISIIRSNPSQFTYTLFRFLKWWNMDTENVLAKDEIPPASTPAEPVKK
jgi:hypothetical protein